METDLAHGMMERRTALSGFVGRRLKFRATVMRGGTSVIDRRVYSTTLVAFVHVGGEGGPRVGHHLWVVGRDLTLGGFCRPGDVIDFTARVSSYRGTDPGSGQGVTRFGLHDPEDVVRVGPMLLGEAVRQMVEVWGWEDVADAVAGCQPG